MTSTGIYIHVAVDGKARKAKAMGSHAQVDLGLNIGLMARDMARHESGR